MKVQEAKKCNTCGGTYDDSLTFCPNDGQRLVVIDALIGKILDGRYRIESLLGRGGMGVVYKATHVHIDTEFAVKVLHPELVANQQAIERFRREARAAGRIHHPNAIRVTDFGVTEEKIVYLVMEIVEGEPLRELLNRQGALDPIRVVNIVRQACGAVEAAHQKGVIHRDLKPDNIMIEREGDFDRIKVLDFGIAKLKELSSFAGAGQALTREGSLIGTPEYMSPEQCRGQALDARSDIYSLGVILYEMLTGQPPFTAETPLEVVFKHMRDATPPLRELVPNIPELIEQVVLRALGKEPDDRQPSAAALSAELYDAARAAQGDYSTNIMPVASPTPTDLLQRETIGPELRRPTGENRPHSQDPALGGRQSLGAPSTPVPTPPSLFKTMIGTGMIGGLVKSRPLMSAMVAALLILVLGVGAYFVFKSSAPIVVNKPGVNPPPPEGMVSIPGGKFMMGRNDGEEDERPPREVEVKPFYLDKYEVTNQQYKKFIEALKHPAPKNWKNGSYALDEATLPVTYVTWQDATAYAKWAGKRLPTEAEWEYAARGGNKQFLYPWGNEWRDGYANVNRQDRPKPAPVGIFENDRSPFGVYDLAGNVSEWVNDFYSKKYGDPPDEKLKVYRGGNFLDDPKQATNTFRWSEFLNGARESQTLRIGFRCAKDVEK